MRHAATTLPATRVRLGPRGLGTAGCRTTLCTLKDLRASAFGDGLNGRVLNPSLHGDRIESFTDVLETCDHGDLMPLEQLFLDRRRRCKNAFTGFPEGRQQSAVLKFSADERTDVVG